MSFGLGYGRDGLRRGVERRDGLRRDVGRRDERGVGSRCRLKDGGVGYL